MWLLIAITLLGTSTLSAPVISVGQSPLTAPIALSPSMPLNSTLKDIDTEIGKKKQNIEDLEKEHDKMLKEIEAINAAINKHVSQLNKLNKAVSSLSDEIEGLNASIELYYMRLNQQKRLIEKRLEALWKQKVIDPITIPIALSIKDIWGAYWANEYLIKLLEHDKSMIRGYYETMFWLNDKRHILLNKTKSLKRTLNLLQEEKRALEESKMAKKQYLNNISQKKDEYMKLLSALNEKRQKIIERLIADKAEKGIEKRYDNNDYKVSNAKDTLYTQDIDDITQYIGTLTPPAFNIRSMKYSYDEKGNINGIFLDVRLGTNVRAIFDGKVTFTGYIKGIGNSIVIDHGSGYTTITGCLSNIFVKTGQTVFEGDIIGISGTCPALNEGIFFETIKDGTDVDPLSVVKLPPIPAGEKPSY